MTNIARGVIATQARQGGFSQRVFTPQVALYEGVFLFFDNYIINVNWLNGSDLETVLTVRRINNDFEPCSDFLQRDRVGRKSFSSGPRRCSDVAFNYDMLEFAGDVTKSAPAFESYVFKRLNYLSALDVVNPLFPVNIALRISGWWFLPGEIGSTVRVDVQGFNGGTIVKQDNGPENRREFLIENPTSSSEVVSLTWDNASTLGTSGSSLFDPIPQNLTIAYISIPATGGILVTREEPA